MTHIYNVQWKQSPCVVYLSGSIASPTPLSEQEIEEAVRNWNLFDWEVYDWDYYMETEVYDVSVLDSYEAPDYEVPDELEDMQSEAEDEQ